MNEFLDTLPAASMPDEASSRREWVVGILGGLSCYGLILWLL